MSTSISELKSKSMFFGNVGNIGKAKTVQSKDNFSEIFDKTQNPSEESEQNVMAQNDKVGKKDDADSIQNHANIQKNKSSEQVKEQTETMKVVKSEEELENAAVEAASEMIQQIADTFQVTPEEVESVLESLGLTALDLLNPENLTNVVLALNPECDALTLMTNEELYTDLKSLMSTAEGLREQLVQDFGMSEEELDSVLSALKENAQMQLPAEEVMQTPEVVVEAKAEKTEVRSNVSTVELIDNVKYDGTVLPKTEEVYDSREHSSEKGEESGNLTGQNFNQNFVEKLADAVENTGSASSFSEGIRGQDIMNQITEQIRVHVKQDTTEMELQLHPASLGNVKVQITSAGGVMTAVFTTENETVKAALEAQLIQLKDNFTQQGLKVESIEVNVSAHGFERSLDQQEQEQNRFEESRNKKGNRRIRLNSLEDVEGILAEDIASDDRIVADMMIRNGNTVDYTV